MAKPKPKSRKPIERIVEASRSPLLPLQKRLNGAPISLNDFVMTISDSDPDVPDLDEDESATDPADEKPAGLEPGPETLTKRSKKRKRVEQQVAQAEHKADSGGLDPDFEFQTLEAGDLVGGYEGWGFEGIKAAMKDSKKGVDIDEIIQRRRTRRNRGSPRVEGPFNQEDYQKGGEEGASDSKPELEEDRRGDGEAAEVKFVGFHEDDEDVAVDGFGMGAESDDEGEDGEISSELDSDSEGHEESDDESVASAIPHPDDEGSVASDTENAEEAAKKAAYFAPEDEELAPDDPSLSFQNMNLSRPILRGLTNVGFVTPTTIQRKTIPVALLGKDIVGGAQTGSGKTAAFVVPILERLLYRPKKVPTSRVLILCPTRELAMQAHDVARKLAAYTDIKFALAVGGLSLKVQEAELKKRPDVIIATPGRFIDHMRNSSGFTVETIEIVVMDEADRMLEDGFADELNEIVNTIPKSRQTMLFSATMTDSVDKLVRLSLNRPVRLLVDAQRSTVKTLVQEFVRIRPQREKYRLAMLIHLCKEFATSRCIIFFRSKMFAHKVRVVFGLFGLKAAELHGSLTQEQRVKSVEAFRDAKVDFLLATDLASRGLDIKGVDIVINYEAPQSHDIYLHRVGRTARAGRQGRSITLAAEADRKVVKSAVKRAQEQGAKVVSRILDNSKVNTVHERITKLEGEIEEVLKEESEEKEIQNMEMRVRRTENIAKHEDEIKARPKRTWFETQQEKDRREKRSKAELNGIALPVKKEKLSGKKRKREEAKEGRKYKKTKRDKDERAPARKRQLVKSKAIGKPKVSPKAKAARRKKR